MPIPNIPVPVPRSRIFCGFCGMGARNSFFSNSITYLACDMSIRSNSSSSIGNPYSERHTPWLVDTGEYIAMLCTRLRGQTPHMFSHSHGPHAQSQKKGCLLDCPH